MPCSNCCSPDQVRDGCADTGAFVANFCCGCLPRRVCVSLFTDSNSLNDPDWSFYEPVSSVESTWCDSGGNSSRMYSGTLLYGESEIDYKIYFFKDSYSHCYMMLESEFLGYTGENALLEPMGGSYFDPAVKKSQCGEMRFSWSVQLYDTSAEITIAPGDYVVQPVRRIPTHCLYNRVCVTVFDGYEEIVQYACFDESYEVWMTDVDGDPNKRVTIYLESGVENSIEGVQLRLSSYLGSGDTKDALCPQMYAKWDLPAGRWIKVIGDRQAKCVDCKYHCRCLCVTFANGVDTIQRTATCVSNGYDGCDTVWHVEIGGYQLAFTLACIGCETLRTYLVMDAPPGTTLIGDSRKSVVCPDRLTASWFLDPGDDTVISIDVECKSCGDKCDVDDLSQFVACCPDRTTGIPSTLYATIESSTDCPQLNGQVIPLVKQVPVQADIPCWRGSLTVSLFGNSCVQRFALMCTTSDGEENVWRLVQGDCGSFSSAANTMTVVSCDPLDLLITINGVGCCDGGIGASVTVRVTE